MKDEDGDDGSSSHVLSHPDSHSSLDAERLRNFQTLVRGEEWGRIEQINENDTLWWQPNASGWTSVHYAASLSLPLERWHWVLQQQQKSGDHQNSASLHLFDQKTCLGQSVWDIFFDTAIKPLPWQSEVVKNQARILLQALKIVLRNPQKELWMPEFRRILRQHIAQAEIGCWIDNARELQHAFRTTGKRVAAACARCLYFLLRLLLLCRASGYRDQIMHAIARAGGTCPNDALAEFLWTLFPCHEALHVWAATPHVTAMPWDEPPTPWLQVALCLWPKVLDSRDIPTGRTLLQAAMATGKPWLTLQCLMHPSAPSNSPDPITGLPLVALRATSHCIDAKAALIRACQDSAGPRGLMTGWTLRRVGWQEAAIESADETLHAEELSILYSLLRSQPLARSGHTSHQKER